MVQVIAIIVPVLSLIIFGLIAYSVHQLVERVNDRISAIDHKVQEHIDECNAIDKNVLALKIDYTRKELSRLREYVSWLGTCIMIIASKLGVIKELPPQPRLIGEGDFNNEP
jgi:mevalonate kinase